MESTAVLRDRIRSKLGRAWSNTLLEEKGLFDFAKGTSSTEWNLAAHFAWRVRSEFPDYDCDVELRKGDFDGKRPDIVIHRRGSHHFNHLVIEVKPAVYGRLDDIEKILANWFAAPLLYGFGASVVLSRTGSDIEVSRNDAAPADRFKSPPKRKP
jgi:hypothetical protein